MEKKNEKLILWFKDIRSEDVSLVGGKNASLGEMYSNLTSQGVNVPNGFALTSNFYWYYLKYNKIDKKIKEILDKFNPKSITSLQQTGKSIRKLILDGQIPPDVKSDILEYYRELSLQYKQNAADVAVRSSATAEDLPTASFAGAHETYLNIKGEEKLFRAIKKSIASLFNDRAIVYREENGFDHLKIALSSGIQKMVRSDLASSGVMFTLDTETGFENVVLINSIYGLGELIVKGKITPDTFYVFKPTLKKGYKAIIRKDLGRKFVKYVYSQKGGIKEVSVPKNKQFEFSLDDDEILTLAKWALVIEDHYSKKAGKWMPQDIEWAKDGRSGQLFIVQSRPETIHTQRDVQYYQEYKINTKKEPILTGIAIGNKIGVGKAHIIEDVSKIGEFKKGEVLVTRMTDPDWVSIFPLASAILTEEGGATCHAAIVSREMGIPCIVGAKDALKKVKTGDIITIDCTQGRAGRIFEGKIPFKIKKYNLKQIPKLKTKITLNIGAPEIAFQNSFLPQDGVGLAREEFIIAEKIKIHPLALHHFKNLKDKKLKKTIQDLTVEHKDKKEYFIKELAEGIAQIAAAFYPKEVIVRFSDFKTNEYKNLIGGELFEGEEENPMLGFRGACRYVDPGFQPAFLMECEAIKRVRNVFGLKNVNVMVPFCRTIDEAKKVKDLIKKSGLDIGKNQSKGVSNLKLYVMCEIPSNVILAEEFLDIFDGMSIGSNDLTQLVLGLDRDNAKIAKIGDERNEAVKEMVKRVIEICKKRGKYVGICGQAPSDFPEFAKFLIDCGIKNISLNPDTVMKTIFYLATTNE
ncbi:MAG: phosphoenolpyruvate synthase [Candidatus Pacebacteria bacterium]|nr:phosphoenolpyruvate synthase [Candidatus Paceibacterota bacterium]